MTYPYALPRLPYAPAALEPNLNRATIMTHHDRIFAGHIDGLNRALQPYPALQRRPLSRLLLHPDCLPAPARPDILHHGRGVYSHAIYFSSLAPARTGNPDAALAEALRCSFGSMEDFLRALRQASLQDTQEGCTWLLCDRCGRLRLLFTPGLQTALPLVPILCLDLHRHAYQLTCGDDREAYVNAALPLLNWEILSLRYATVSAGQPPFPNP